MEISVSDHEKFRQAEILLRFVNLYVDAEQRSRDYGTGENVSMAAIHLLCTIRENPGIGGIQLAERFYCTPSAVSQNLTWLEKRGYLRRELLAGQGKVKTNYVTEKGLVLCDAHQHSDAAMLSELYHRLLQNCTADEINAFYRVMYYFNEIMAEERRRRGENYRITAPEMESDLQLLEDH